MLPGAALAGGAPPADIDAKLDRLVKAYPDYIAERDGNWLVMKSGERFQISDGRSDKSFDEMLAHPDIDDMFYADYPAGAAATAPEADIDPGRVRYAPLFDAMYGDCKTVRMRHLVVAWLPKHHGGTVDFSSENGAAAALAAVSAELDELPERFMKYLIPNSGTFNCRDVAGTSTKSMHGRMAAIDINSERADYWRWSKEGWHNRVPMEIVRIFERHGFIWGGRWSHYDTMHFEYRPELLP
ncbi:MAG: M15 family metallopeptidase [Proteobacteria bacterium]|nr:M15 family metallopeptidase [Pseudomonadota bacterium]